MMMTAFLNAMSDLVKKGISAGLVIVCSHLQAAENEIGAVTRGGPDVTIPKSSTDNLKAYYGVGYPVQMGSKKAALFCNLRVIGVKTSDYEDGADVFVFDELKDVGKGDPMPITRNERERDAKTGEQRFIVKYPPTVGFWPLGAKRSDGSAHPGEGKGFAMCQALSLVGSGKELTWNMYSESSVKHYAEVMTLAFDGQRVSVIQRNLIRTGEMWATPDGWGIRSPGLQPAIPDGDDLLMAVSAAKKGGVGGTGVCRFRFLEGQWRPFSFTQVAGGAEPSLARRGDGALIFTTRADGSEKNSIVLWVSHDNSETWKHIFRAEYVRPSTPVSVHATPDGRIFVLANLSSITNSDGTVRWWQTARTRLVLWQLAEGAAAFAPPWPRVVRDCQEEFGVTDKFMWYVDHPVSATVQLSDGQWHGLVAYRVMNFSIYGDKVGEQVTPHTGCYVEEVSSAQPAKPPWQF